MTEKIPVELFILEIDRIVSGDSISPSEYEHCGEEYKELLLLAKMLVQADYSAKYKGLPAKTAITSGEYGEMVDDDLDLVAGGVNFSDLSAKKRKQDDI